MLSKHENCFNSVQHVRIHKDQNLPKFSYYFPNATKLTVIDQSYTAYDNIVDSFNRILPIQKLTKLVIGCQPFPIQKLMAILCCTPNLRILSLQSIIGYRELTDYELLQNSKDFQEASKINSVTNITCHCQIELEHLQLLVALCPRMRHLRLTNTIEMEVAEMESITRFLLNKDNQNTRQLCSLCFREIYKTLFLPLEKLIKSENLLNDYILKLINSV